MSSDFTACMAFHDHQLTVTQFYDWLVAHGAWDALLMGGMFRDIVNLCGGA